MTKSRITRRAIAISTCVAVGASVLSGVLASSGEAQQPPTPTPATQTRAALPPSPAPAIVWDPIRFTRQRAVQMARYSYRHYGLPTYFLKNPKVIVLHYTVSDTYSSTHNWFNQNNPAPGPAGTRPETPGPCTQFIIDKNGRIYQQVPLAIMCRHVIGLNHVAIGIEFVEMHNAAFILRRPAQLIAGRKLVRYLQSRFGISKSNVVGHGTANWSPYFRDLRGWRNDHTDWNQQQVRIFNLGVRP